jgi:uncharacterized protein YebE (UPF0316 family)
MVNFNPMENFDYFNWIILPVLIFLARMSDVTLATLRNIFISKGFRNIVPLIGFFEVLIWLLAARQVFGNLNNPACFIAWAGGFATGTYIGMRLDEYLALGMQMVRIITNQNPEILIKQLSEKNHGVTVVDGHGAVGPVKLIFTVVKRKSLKEVTESINSHLPDSFYSIEDVRSSSSGVFVAESKLGLIRSLFPVRKGK